MEYKKYVIFFGIVLIVAGTIACGGKDTVSEKDRIKDIEVLVFYIYIKKLSYE